MASMIVGFSRPKGWFNPFSWLIRLVTWSAFSHAYIKYYNSYADRWIIFQASGLKVNFIGETMFDAAEDVYAEFEIPISDATKQTVVKKAVDKCGSPYGVWQIVGFGWVLFMRLFRKSVPNPFYSPSSFVCSELVSDILIDINQGNMDPSAMTPQDVYNFLVSKGFKPSA